MSREHLEERPIATRLDDRVYLVGLSRVLPLSSSQEIHLPSPGRRCPETSLGAEED